MRLLRCCLVLVLLGICCSLAHASPLCTTSTPGNISCNGVFPQDLFYAELPYTSQIGGDVTATTTSFATGGFQPVLTLFDANGGYLDSNYATFGSSLDTTLTWTADPNAIYWLVLTEYDNTWSGVDLNPNTPNPSFTEYANWVNNLGFGEPTSPIPNEVLNFTAYPPFVASAGGLSGTGTSFLLSDGSQRTGNWSLTISGPEDVFVIPEPAPLFFLGGGVLMLAGLIRFRRRS